VVQSIVGTLASVLIGIFLYPLLPFVTFYVYVAAYYAFAHAYDEAVGATAHGDGAAGTATSTPVSDAEDAPSV